MKFVIGLTGGTGAGKSAAAEYFNKLGAHIVDADKISREVTAPGMPALLEINEAFPRTVKNNVLDRKALGAIVFGNEEKLEILNKITHKYIVKRSKELIDKKDGLVVLDAPLLYEAGCDKFCDKVIFITADKEIRKKRIIERDGLSPDDAERRICSRNLYLPCEKADYVIENDGDIHKLFTELDKIMKGFAINK